MNKAVFLDRDGTLNIDYGYVYKIEDFKLIDGTIEALKKLSDLGYMLIIITNQSGIARGYYTEEDLLKLNNYLISNLKQYGIKIEAIYYCPHIDSDNCNCRKPKLELFYKAIKEHDIDIVNSYAIGDKPRDLSICSKEKIKPILISDKKIENYICRRNLLEASEYIESQNSNNI